MLLPSDQLELKSSQITILKIGLEIKSVRALGHDSTGWIIIEHDN
jgi:hypothetical protein